MHLWKQTKKKQNMTFRILCDNKYQEREPPNKKSVIIKIHKQTKTLQTLNESMLLKIKKNKQYKHFILKIPYST